MIASQIHWAFVDLSSQDCADDVAAAMPLPGGNPVRTAERATQLCCHPRQKTR